MKQSPQPLSNYLDKPRKPDGKGEQSIPPRRRLPLKKIGYISAGVATVLLLIWAFRPAPVFVDVGQVQRGELQVTVNAEGKTRVRDRFVIASETDGHLARITLNEGDPVTPGMVVARIDPLPSDAAVQAALGRLAEWKAQRAGVETQRPKAESVEQARTRIRSAEARQRQSEARVIQTRAALEQAQRDRDRAMQLEATGAISRQSREAAELNATTRAKELETALLAAKADASEVEVAKAALAVVQQERKDPDYLLKVYDARIASTEAELSKLRDEAARTDIRSPAAGRVLRIHQKSAQFVNSGTPLLDIGNPARLELVIDVLSSDAEKIQPGHPILLGQGRHSGSTEQPIQARVRLVEPSAFTKVSALGVEEQRVNVIGDFVNAAQSLGDGFRVDTRIVIWEGKNSLKTPISSLFRCQQSAWCVFVVENGRASQRQIVIGQRSDREAEVRQGLNPGELVILHPTEQVRDGVRVRARSQER
ncbi:HlyD family efflux transporter periplasmic adaptor subunit [Leptothermofonsia sichuanensis E412]|uniref:efflux RND transporter periplasmic adaptor subunit n=1 Tax=Leptothermofonsia sichuanensis TaxID=2917832 RepID=UPI001CA6518D|nr:HlyD family efflux transporter periplasmic adaptor subunit [Leptothermofonsia sichuanensis]QZZ21449.1 HlyD family efflux transporter periplasmic adaptor subunit [Leptothermofonsia sichuanensis E412]